MRPALSVILLTTLIGAGQGLFASLFLVEIAERAGAVGPVAERFYLLGAALSCALVFAGLFASFFHLGRPEKAWRAAAMWRTSWLSREVIVLPAFIAAVLAYGLAHAHARDATPWLGATALVLCAALFVCTGMIYACLKFLQEWHTPLTIWNFVLLGAASGATLAAALAAAVQQALALPLGWAAAAVTAAAFVVRCAMLVRNARLVPRSTLQTAIGIAHPRIEQKSQGQMGGSFNTREFFHGRTRAFLRSVKWAFLLLVFPVPVLLVGVGLATGAVGWMAAAFLVQYAGLLAERWFFFAQARHPQNLYYQVIS